MLDKARATSLLLVTAVASAVWLDISDELGEGRNLLAAAVIAIGLSAAGAMLSRGAAEPRRRARWLAWAIYLGAMASCVTLIAVIAAIAPKV